MIKYYKIIDNKKVIKTLREIVIRKNGKQIINPTETMVLEDGWALYYVDNTIIETHKTLEEVKQEKIRDVQIYDKSDSVELFYINDIPLWLDRDDRNILQRRFEIEHKNGIIQSTLWKDGVAFSLNIEEAIIMLELLELYAIQSFDCTQRHIANINALENIEDVLNYDYTSGYPTKLHF